MWRDVMWNDATCLFAPTIPYQTTEISIQYLCRPLQYTISRFLWFDSSWCLSTLANWLFFLSRFPSILCVAGLSSLLFTFFVLDISLFSLFYFIESEKLQSTIFVIWLQNGIFWSKWKRKKLLRKPYSFFSYSNFIQNWIFKFKPCVITWTWNIL